MLDLVLRPLRSALGVLERDASRPLEQTEHEMQRAERLLRFRRHSERADTEAPDATS